MTLQVSGTSWPDMTRTAAKTILLLALAEPIGVLLRTSNREATVRALYAAKYAAGAAAGLEGLQIRTWAGADGDVVVCHRKPNLAGATPETE